MGIEPRQFQQSDYARIFFAGGFMQHHYLPRTFLFNHTAPQVWRAGALRRDLGMVRRLDDSHLFPLTSLGDNAVDSSATGRQFYSPEGESNVKNMLKSEVTLWKRESKVEIGISHCS